MDPRNLSSKIKRILSPILEQASSSTASIQRTFRLLPERDEKSEKDKRPEPTAFQEYQLARACPSGWAWGRSRRRDGYECAYGGHFVSDKELATGILPNDKFRHLIPDRLDRWIFLENKGGEPFSKLNGGM
jgi:hypothetical protein